jgi:hypothetical protein
MMRPVRRLPLSVLLVSLSFAGLGVGCGIDQFEDTITDETTIPATAWGSSIFQPSFGSGLSAIDLSKSQTFQNNDVDPNDVDSITIKTITLEVSTGSNNPLLDRLDLYIEKVTFWVQSPSQPKVIIGERSDIPRAASMDLTIPMVELKPYATDSSMTVTADVDPKMQPAVNVKLKTTIVIRVDVNILGQ